MRHYLIPGLAALAALHLGCGGSTPSAPSTSANPAEMSPQVAAALASHSLLETTVGRFTIAIDPTALTATATPIAMRTAVANDDLYDLSIANFTQRDTIAVRAVERTATTLDITYDITHPFAAPTNLAGPATAANRADLGVAGRLMFLFDVPSATGNTYLTGIADAVANTSTVANADGFFKPGGLLPGLTQVADTFPYLSLVDESGADGSRNGISNGGSPTGNYNVADGGWQQTNIGFDNNGWTGFGVLHQGQSSRRTLSINLSALSGPISIETVILAKYNDPRQGANAATKRANRLPKNPPDPSQFAYRMPHGAIDVESTAYYGESGGFIPNSISASTLNFGVVDWDARAAETTEADLAVDPLVGNVAVGESGAPTLYVNIPAVHGTAFETLDPATDLSDDDSAFGGDAALDLGVPGDRLYYSKTITNSGIGQVSGPATGMVFADDVENSIDTSAWHFSLAPDLTPATAPPENGNYQAFTVTLAPLSAPPTATYIVTTPNVVTGNTASIAVNGIADPESDPVQILVDWDDNGTYSLATTVNAPYPGSVPLTSPINYTYVAPDPDTRDLPVRISDGGSNVDLLPTQTFDVLATAPLCGAAMVGANRGAWGTTSVVTSWITVFGTANTRAGNDFGAFHSATLNEFIAMRYTTTGAVFDLYRLSPTPVVTATRISNTGAFFSGKIAHQIEADSTNRVLVATKGPSSSDGDPTEIYGASSSSNAQVGIHWFDYDGVTPATVINTISTGTNRVVALTLDQNDNLYYVDTTNILHKLNKATAYSEVVSAPFPLDLKAAPYNIVPPTLRVQDLMINFHNQAFFILTTSPTASGQDPRLFRVECDGALYVSTGSTNPVQFPGYDSNAGHDLYIDQWTTGGTLTNEADVQIVVANAVLSVPADGPGFRVFNSDLVNTATWDDTVADSFGKIAIVNNVMLGKQNYFGPTNFQMNFTPPAGWQ